MPTEFFRSLVGIITLGEEERDRFSTTQGPLRFPFPTRTTIGIVMGLLLLSAGCGRFLTRPRKHRHFSLNPIAQPILLYIQVVASLHVEPEAVSGSEVPG